ncbi:hypothetical protein MVEN_00086900 [Mycena venus]|uniref:Uncharacterized protein n=1 Tax=Mycena venus TaxID=2733690 RepID=A0A8H6Z7G2_9AGAR|nr:hypothetical protein MVEN_00086900 [Mycena venus]
MDSAHYWLATHPDQVPVVEQLLIGYLRSTLPSWKRFSSEFELGGPIYSLTPAEKLAVCIPPTNDANESILGGLCDYSRVCGINSKQAEKEAEAAAELARLRSIAVITDAQQLKALPVKKKGKANLREQLDDISKKDDMLAAILSADQRHAANTPPVDASVP